MSSDLDDLGLVLAEDGGDVGHQFGDAGDQVAGHVLPLGQMRRGGA